MKKYYLTTLALLVTYLISAQGYEFGIQHNGGYSFSIVATPDFDGTNTDISDIGFALMLPAGSADIVNETQFNGRSFGITEATGAQLSGLGLGDGTRDAFIVNLPPGQTILSHSNGVSFELISFEVSNSPVSGSLEILDNSDPIVSGLGGSADSFYNANIDMTSTQNYFAGLAAGMDEFMFETLSIEETVFDQNRLKIYPNPTNNMVYFQSDLEINNIALYDVTGKMVFENNTNQINLSTFPSGLYFVKIKINDQVIIKRIIRE